MQVDPSSASLHLASLVERLRKSGFRIDTRQYLLAHEFLLARAGSDEDPADPARLASQLGPIFCTSLEEQSRFGEELRQWLGQGPPEPLPPPPGSPKVQRHSAQLRRLLALSALAASAIVVALSLWTWQSGRETILMAPPIQAPRPADVVTAPPAIAETPRTAWLTLMIAAFVVTGLAFGVGWVVDRARRQLALRRLSTFDDPERLTLSVPETAIGLVAEATVRRAAAALSRPREGTTLDLDVEATVDQTARAGGFFSPRFSARRSVQEYVALVSRRGSDDHQAVVFDTFLKQLRGRGIALDTYSFHDDPRVCYWDESGQGRRLGEIVGRHHRATLIVCADAHVAFSGTTGALARWIDATTPLERRVFWTPEAPYRWSRREFELVDAGFIVIPATEEGWRALVDLDDGWRPEALYPAPYARPFPEILGANERRWLDRNEPPPDTGDRLVRQTAEFLGPTGFGWLCACAVYPEITWGLTLRVAGDAPDYSVLPSLARLPWLRHGFMPDWLRHRLLRQLAPDVGDRLRTNLERLLEDLARTSRASTSVVTRSVLHIGRWIGSIKTLDVLLAAPEGSPLRDHVFLGFMARANITPLSLAVPESVGRLFHGRVGRFGGALKFDHRNNSLARQLLGRLRGWALFHPAAVRLVQSVTLGLLLLILWRPPQAPVPTTLTKPPETNLVAPQPAAQPSASAPVPLEPTGDRSGSSTAAANTQSQAQPTRAPAVDNRGGSGVGGKLESGAVTVPPPSEPAPPQPTPGQAADARVPETRPEADTGAAGRGAAGVVDVNPVPSGLPAVPVATEASAREPASAPDAEAAIRQLLQGYASALESLDVAAVQALYPSVNRATLAEAFRNYRSLKQDIVIKGIDVAPDGQSASVAAVVTTSPVVRIGRASPVTRPVTFGLRRSGNAWLIEQVK